MSTCLNIYIIKGFIKTRHDFVFNTDSIEYFKDKNITNYYYILLIINKTNSNKS